MAGTITVTVLEAKAKSVKFQWTEITTTALYNVYIDNTSMGETIYTKLKCSDMILTVDSGIIPSERYLIRVDALDGNTVIGSGSVYFQSSYLPDAPINLVSTSVGSKSISIKWDLPTDGADSYRVYCNSNIIMQQFTTKNTSMEIKNLRPSTYYTIGVCGLNNYSEEGTCSIIQVRTKDAPSESIIPEFKDVGIKKFTVTWDAVVGAASYNVYVSKKGEKAQKDNVTSLSKTYTNLTPDTYYTVIVAAVDSDGAEGPFIDYGVKTLKAPFLIARKENRAISLYRVWKKKKNELFDVRGIYVQKGNERRKVINQYK